MTKRSSKGIFSLLLAVPLVVPFHVPALEAQEAVVRVEENLRAEPNGTVLGRLEPGTRVVVEGGEGNWTRVTLEGYVWTASLQVLREGGFDLVVSASGGENFRDEPSGRVAARLETGTRLEEIERVPGWIRVRRTAWIWSPSLLADETGEAGPAVEQAVPAGEDAEREAPQRDRWVRASDRGAAILTAPDGDTLALTRAGSELRMLDREGRWVRVQLDGWVWWPDGEVEEAGEDAQPQRITASDLAAEPDRYRGRVVEMELQFISLERAERVRVDFYEGEPYLLTRALGAERVFVYVAVPPRELDAMRRFTPLERLRVVGRVRSGAAELTGNPILDMLELERRP